MQAKAPTISLCPRAEELVREDRLARSRGIFLDDEGLLATGLRTALRTMEQAHIAMLLFRAEIHSATG